MKIYNERQEALHRRERRREICHKYYMKNKEKLAAKDKAWRHKNVAAVKAMNKTQYNKRTTTRTQEIQKIKRISHLAKTYNLTIAQYDKMLRQQAGGCYICERPPKTRRLAVDHNHKTGKVRGLLCWHCNSGLGKFKDNPELLIRAADYLQKEE